MKIKIKNFDYLVIKSGYTSRLLNKWNFESITTIKPESDEKSLRGDGIFSISQPNRCFTNNDDEDELFNDIMDSILFINDGLWGKGLYKMENKEEDINVVLDTLNKNDEEFDGVICFKSYNDMTLLTDYYDIKSLLEESEYCVFGNIYAITYLEENGTRVCIIEHDCESG